MKKEHYKKTLKIGKHGNGKRVVIWATKMLEAGFDFGTPITIKQGKRGLTIVPGGGPRVICSVMNHGRRLPVIDLKGKIVDSFDTSHVMVKITDNKITISPTEVGV